MKKDIADLFGLIGENSDLKPLAGRKTLANCWEIQRTNHVSS
jgi:hypothetical protein